MNLDRWKAWVEPLRRLEKKTLWPVLVLVGSLLASTALVALRPDPKPHDLEDTTPLVEVVVAQPGAGRMTVRAQGTLEPGNETELVAEAGGRVVWLSPSFDGDGRFAKGEVLVKLASDDYEITAERARAAYERAESQRTLASAGLARSQALLDGGAVSAAAHDQTRANERIAAANLRDAAAALHQAELDLSRTRIRAPFAGRVRERSVAIGQFVARGASVARVYSAEAAEVRLSLRSEDAAFLELPSRPSDAGPRVVLTGTVAGEQRRFEGRIVRSAGGLDRLTRMLTVVARIDAPKGAEPSAAAMGAFLDAEIEGREVAGVVRLPRSALVAEDTVAVVDADSKLRLREVEVLRADSENAWISDGLAKGEKVCAHLPSALAPGALVRTEIQRDAQGDVLLHAGASAGARP